MAFESSHPQTGAWQTAYLMSLTDYNPGIWQDPDQACLGMRRRRARQPDTIRPVYQWDLHGLVSYFSRTSDGSGYYTVSHMNPYWYGIMAESLDVDTGSNVFAHLPSAFTVPAFTHPVAGGHQSSASLSFSPLMPKWDEVGLFRENSPNYSGELKVREATLVPGAPFLIASTMTAQDFYGPVFATSVDYSVEGSGSLSPVSVRVSWEGGKSVISPVMAQFLPFAGDLSPLYTNELRSATLLDCGFDCAAHYTVEDLRLSMATSREWSAERLVGMRLSVSQRLEMTNTCHSPGRSDKHGPRFASIADRAVSGSVTFAGREEFPDFPGMQAGGTGSVTMYFGGPFFYTMENVEWNRPRNTISAGAVPSQEFSFIARAANSSVQKPYQPETPDYPYSEFAFVDPADLDPPNTGDDEDDDERA